MCERPILPQITLIIADKPQNHKTALTSPNCLSLRNNAACCIPLRDLRYLRENTRKSTQSICTKKPQCLPQISLIYADEPQNSKIPNCLSLRNNAACCIPLRDLRYLRENTRKSTQTIRTEETPMSPADLADLRRQNPKPQQHHKLSFSAI